MNQNTLQKASYLSNIPTMAMSFLLPLYCIELGFTPIETTGLFAVVSFALLISRLMIGDACDKTGRKKILCLGLGIKAVSYVSLAFSQSAILLYIAQTLNGVAISFSSVAIYAFMSDVREHDFALRKAKISSSSGKGQLIGVAVCWGLLSFRSFTETWKYLFLISAAFALYAALFSSRTLVETKHEVVSPKINISKKLQKLFCVNILLTIATSIINVILMLYLFNRFSARTDFMAFILLVPAAIITYISPAIGKTIVRHGEKRCFAWGCTGAAAFLCTIPFLNSLVFFAIIWTIYNIFATFSSLAFDSMVSVNTDVEIMGKVSGAYMASTSLGTFTGSVASGILFQLFSIAMPFYIAAIFFIAAFWAIVFVMPVNNNIE